MIVLYVAAAVVAVLFLGWLLHRIHHRRQMLAVTERVPEGNRRGRPMAGQAERQWLYLSQKGIQYRKGRRISPVDYMQTRVLSGLIGAYIGVGIGLFMSLNYLWLFLTVILCYGIGYFAPDFYYLCENHEDNRRILKDIHVVYDTLRVYLAVDIFITDALEECYRRIHHKRLKTAIYELKEGLKSQAEQLSEIESFRCKFDNPHINQLANLLSQYYRSGNVSTMMEDLSEQMLAIDHALHIQMKERMEWRSLIKEVLVLIGMLGGIAVALIESISRLMEEFF